MHDICCWKERSLLVHFWWRSKAISYCDTIGKWCQSLASTILAGILDIRHSTRHRASLISNEDEVSRHSYVLTAESLCHGVWGKYIARGWPRIFCWSTKGPLPTILVPATPAVTCRSTDLRSSIGGLDEITGKMWGWAELWRINGIRYKLWCLAARERSRVRGPFEHASDTPGAAICCGTSKRWYSVISTFLSPKITTIL